MRKIDFYRLPRPVQDRFAAATRHTAPPAPLHFRAAPRTTVWGWLAASAVLAALAGILLHQGTGDIDSSVALHGFKMLFVDVALLSASAYGVVHAISILRAIEASPYLPGVYVFPACVIDAREAQMRVWPVGEAAGIEVVASPSPGLALRMRDGEKVVVGAASVDEARRAETALDGMRPGLARALEEEDPHQLADLDPLHDRAMSSPIGPTESMRPAVPLWTRLDWALAVAAGVALGLVLGSTRNTISDQAMFRTVVAAGSIPSYKAYLAQQGKHSEEVRDVLLPRAELREAQAQGTVEAVEAFARDHTATKIGPEIDEALRAALLRQLDQAKKAGTLAALDQFAHAYPDSKLDSELAAARHSLYTQALAAWKKKTQPDAAVGAFFERLVGWAERTGRATCETRFRPRPSKSLAAADQKTTKSDHFPGPDALPSAYLTADALAARERRVAQDVAQAFATSFPSDVLTMKIGDPLTEDAAIPTNEPTLVIDYGVEWTHTTTASTKPRTVFANFAFSFDTTFTQPDPGPPLKTATRSWRGAELWKVKTEGRSREEYQQAVYDLMMDGAFDQLDKRLLDGLF